MPTAGPVTQPTCTVSTGSVTLGNLPGGNWKIKSGNTIITGTGTSYPISGLTAGTYNFTVTNASGCTSTASSNIVVHAVPTVPSKVTVVMITQPTATISTGSVVLSGLPATGTINPGNIPIAGST